MSVRRCVGTGTRQTEPYMICRAAFGGLCECGSGWELKSAQTMVQLPEGYAANGRPGNVDERVRPPAVDDQLAALNAAEQVGERIVDHLGPPDAVHEPEPDDGARTVHQRAAGDLVGLARGDPVGDQAAKRRQG